MKLNKINIKNFLSISNATIDLNNRGIVLIDGINNTPATTIDTNGTGKSSMLSAIFYSIYGELPNGEKADSLINRSSGKNMCVELEFSVSGIEYKIIRGRKKNKLNLVSDGNDITKGTMKETQSVIDSIIGIPKDVYLSTIYFDGHNSIPFSMLTDKQRKDYLEVLFDVGIYKKAHEQTKLDIVSVKNEISQYQQDYKNISNEIDNEKSVISQFESIKSDSSKSISELEEKYKQELSKKDANDTKYESSIKKINENKSELNNIINSNDDFEYTDKKQRFTKLSDEYNSMVARLSSNKATINEKAATIKDMSNSDICPVCGNPIDEEHKEKEVSRLMEILSPLVLKYRDDKDSLSKKENELSKIKEELKSIEDRHSKLEANKRDAYSKLQDINGLEQGLKINYNTYLSSLNQAKESYEKAVDNATKYDSLINQHKDRVGDLNSSKSELYDNIQDKIDYENSLEKALLAFSDKGIKSHVLDLVTPELNNRVADYLSFLTGGTITIHFSTQTRKTDGEMSDKFDIKVTNNGSETSYESLSSGEKRRVDIAISLTLQDILMSKSDTKSNVLIYDELFESLDAVGAESVVELLKKRLNTVDTIFVVTHNENLKPLFSETITAIKEKDGNTHIENGEKVK